MGACPIFDDVQGNLFITFFLSSTASDSTRTMENGWKMDGASSLTFDHSAKEREMKAGYIGSRCVVGINSSFHDLMIPLYSPFKGLTYTHYIRTYLHPSDQMGDTHVSVIASKKGCNRIM